MPDGSVATVVRVDRARPQAVLASLAPFCGRRTKLLGVLQVIAAGRGGWVSRDAIVAEIYPQEDGGPLSANEQVTSSIMKLRRMGWKIRTSYGRGYAWRWDYQ